MRRWLIWVLFGCAVGVLVGVLVSSLASGQGGETGGGGGPGGGGGNNNLSSLNDDAGCLGGNLVLRNGGDSAFDCLPGGAAGLCVVSNGTTAEPGWGTCGGSSITMPTSRLLGRTTAGTGAPENISVSSAFTLSALSLDISKIPPTKVDSDVAGDFGKCAQFDATGTLTAAAGACGTSSGMSSFSLGADTGANATVGNVDLADILGGTGITTAVTSADPTHTVTINLDLTDGVTCTAPLSCASSSITTSMVGPGILGRSSGTGTASTLTGTQATALLDAYTAGVKGLVPSTGLPVSGVTGGTANMCAQFTAGGVLSSAGSACGSGGGAPTGVNYLVGTADGTLTNEIVVGTAPSGELGGTWASPLLADNVTVSGWTLGGTTTIPAAARMAYNTAAFFSPPSGTAFPGSPSAGDTFIVTDDPTVGACTSAGGSSVSLCRYTGSAWAAVGDGVGSGSVPAPGADNQVIISTASGAGNYGWQSITGAPCGNATTDKLYFDGTNIICGTDQGGGAATVLDSGQSSPNANAFDIRWPTAGTPTQTQWYTDVDGDGVVDQGEQLVRDGRKHIYLEPGNNPINAAVTACGTTPCTIHLAPGTYTNTCIGIDSEAHIRITGAGRGNTILTPDTTRTNCANSGSAPIAIVGQPDETMTDIEIDNLEWNGLKTTTVYQTCHFDSTCGHFIYEANSGGWRASRIYVHDNYIHDDTGAGVRADSTTWLRVENNEIAHMGCDTAVEPCGSGATLAGWTGGTVVGSVPNRRSKGHGVVSGSWHSIIRNNKIYWATYGGIELYAGNATATGGGVGVVLPVEVFAPGDVNTSTERITIPGHGYQTGQGPFQLTTSGTLPTGLSTGTNYWIIAVDINTISFASTQANAYVPTPVLLSGTATGIASVKDRGTGIGGGPDLNSDSLIEANSIGNSVIGLSFNGASRARAIGNYIYESNGMGGIGDNGIGILVSGSAHRDLVIEHNLVKASGSNSISIVASDNLDNSGGIVLAHNLVDGGCVDHFSAQGGNILISSTAGHPARGLKVEDNWVTNTNTNATKGCKWGLYSDWVTNAGAGFLGSVIFRGGSYDSGATGAVRIENDNAEIDGLVAVGNTTIASTNARIHGLKITGNLTYTAGSSGKAWGNAVTGTTTYTTGSNISESVTDPVRRYVVSTMTGAAIQAAVTACKTANNAACEIQLLAGTYTDACIYINAHSYPIRIFGAGRGTTFLRHPDLNTGCASVTPDGWQIQIGTTDDVELSDFTIDGHKSDVTYDAAPPANCVGTNQQNGACGGAISLNQPTNTLSHRPRIHDIEIKNVAGMGIQAVKADQGIYENNVITNLGCYDTAHATGPQLCGCAGAHATCRGWDSAPTTETTTFGTKAKGIGISMQKVLLGSPPQGAGTPADTQGNLIRANFVSGSSYEGLSDSDPGDITAGNQWIGNYVTATPTGFSCNGCGNAELAYNTLYKNGIGTTNAGFGASIVGNARQLYIHHNNITNNEGAGLEVGPFSTAGLGQVRVEQNYLYGNCVLHWNGSGDDLSVWGNQVVPGPFSKDAVIFGNIIDSPLCQDGLRVVQWDNAQVIGNQIRSAGTTGRSARFEATNMQVVGNKGVGNMVFTGDATGVAWGNTATSGSVTYDPLSKMTTIEDGLLKLSGGANPGKLQLKEPTGTDTTSFSTQTQSGNVSYILPADDGTSGQVLSTDGGVAGTATLSWANSGTGTVTSVGTSVGAACTGNCLTSTSSDVKIGSADNFSIELNWDAGTRGTFTQFAIATDFDGVPDDWDLLRIAATGTGTGGTTTNKMILGDGVNSVTNVMVEGHFPSFGLEDADFGAQDDPDVNWTATMLTGGLASWMITNKSGSSTRISMLGVETVTGGASTLYLGGVQAEPPPGSYLLNPWPAFSNPNAVTVDEAGLMHANGSGTIISNIMFPSGASSTHAVRYDTGTTRWYVDANDSGTYTAGEYIALAGDLITYDRVDDTTDLTSVGWLANDTWFGTDGVDGGLIFEGSTADGFETFLSVNDPTADRRAYLPNTSGNISVQGATVTSTTPLVLDATSTELNVITGVTDKTVQLPGNLTFGGRNGAVYEIANDTTASTPPKIVTVTSSGGNTVATLSQGQRARVVLNKSSSSDTTAAAWTVLGTKASGQAVLGTSSISANACATVVTGTATGIANTDVIEWTPSTDLNAVTGYGATGTAPGTLIIYPYPTTDTVNFKVCNVSTSSVTPGAASINWKVSR